MDKENKEGLEENASLQESTTRPSEEDSQWLSKTLRFLGGQTCSLFGSSVVQFAIIWYITLETKSGIMMTIATICGIGPQVIISFFGGVWADKYNRKYLILAADGMIATATLITAILFLTGHGSFTLLFIVEGVRSIGAGIQNPTVTALIPQIVPKDKLIKVNGFYGSVQSLTLVLSPAVSGAVLASFGITMTFFIDVITAIIGMCLLFSIPIKKVAREAGETVKGHVEELKEGFRYAMSSIVIRRFILFCGVFMFFLVPASFLTPLMVARSFGDEVWRLTMNEVMFSVGAIVGGLIIGSWGGFKNRIHTVILACILFGPLTSALGLAPNFVVFLIIMCITGTTVPLFNTPAMTLLQEKVDPAMMGRVFAFVQIISTSMMPLGMIIFGPLSDKVSVEFLLIFTGIIITITGIILTFDKKFIAACAPDVDILDGNGSRKVKSFEALEDEIDKNEIAESIAKDAGKAESAVEDAEKAESAVKDAGKVESIVKDTEKNEETR